MAMRKAGHGPINQPRHRWILRQGRILGGGLAGVPGRQLLLVPPRTEQGMLLWPSAGLLMNCPALTEEGVRTRTLPIMARARERVERVLMIVISFPLVSCGFRRS